MTVFLSGAGPVALEFLMYGPEIVDVGARSRPQIDRIRLTAPVALKIKPGAITNGHVVATSLVTLGFLIQQPLRSGQGP